MVGEGKTAARQYLILLCVPVIFLILVMACAPAKTVKRQGPALRLSAETWSFGTIRRGETVAGDLMVTNEGTAPLAISLYSTCECLEAVANTDTIPPAGRAWKPTIIMIGATTSPTNTPQATKPGSPLLCSMTDTPSSPPASLSTPWNSITPPTVRRNSSRPIFHRCALEPFHFLLSPVMVGSSQKSTCNLEADR